MTLKPPGINEPDGTADVNTTGVITARYGLATQVQLGTVISGTPAAITFGLAADTNLYRNLAGQLRTDGSFVAGTTTGGTTQTIFASYIGGAQNRWAVLGDGKQVWSDGTAAVDTNLYRVSAGRLQTDGDLSVLGNLDVTRAGTGAAVIRGFVTGDAVGRFTATVAGFIQWGNGTTQDTNLYRAGAGQLKTDGSITTVTDVVGGGTVYGGNTSGGSGPQRVAMGAIGPGGAAGVTFGLAADTNLYRLTANTLKTDGSLFIGGNANVAGSGQSLIFYSAGAGVAKQTVNGSRGANAALTQLLNALAALNLIVDATTV